MESIKKLMLAFVTKVNKNRSQNALVEAPSLTDLDAATAVLGCRRQASESSDSCAEAEQRQCTRTALKLGGSA